MSSLKSLMGLTGATAGLVAIQKYAFPAAKAAVTAYATDHKVATEVIGTIAKGTISKLAAGTVLGFAGALGGAFLGQKVGEQKIKYQMGEYNSGVRGQPGADGIMFATAVLAKNEGQKKSADWAAFGMIGGAAAGLLLG